MLEKNVLMFFYSLHIQWLLKQFSLRCICNFLIIGTRQQLVKTSIESIIIGDTVINPLESVRSPSWVLVRCSYANECSHRQDL